MLTNKTKNNACVVYGSSLIALLLAGQVYAGQAPDAGRTIQELAPAPELPQPSPQIEILAPEASEVLPGGAQVTLKSLVITGNTVFDTLTLNGVLGEVTGKTYDLAGLKALANKLSAYYRERGYPLARAFIPAQALKDGELTINIVEGRYGAVSIQGDASVASSLQNYLNRLQSGDVVESRNLERAALLLNDLPGLRIAPVLRPGQEVGTSNLDVGVERDKRLSGQVSADNYGNRYTGRHRARLDLDINSPFMLGDRISLRTLYTEEDLWLGSVGYSLPIGSNGLRASIDYSHTYYQLGKEFNVLDANGTAKIASAGLSYPILRSQKSNLTLFAAYQHKRLNDRVDLTNTDTDKSSHVIPLTLSFDHRDSLGGGGVTYGSVSWTHGNLNLDSQLSQLDRNSARTEGSFDKYNLDLVRLQSLPSSFSIYGRISSQIAADNLDSSESFGLGGPNGVRAYPTGEGFGDEGTLGQLELRYSKVLDNGIALSPYVFYDAGRVKINHRKFAPGDNHRSVSGGGLGLRGNYKGFNADVALAWRGSGGQPLSDTNSDQPVLWVNGSYRF